jgi:hypothetical protein
MVEIFCLLGNWVVVTGARHSEADMALAAAVVTEFLWLGSSSGYRVLVA